MTTTTALVDLCEGIAALLAAQATGLAWQTTGVYAANVTGVFILAVPQTPDRLVTLSPYPLGDDPVHADSEVGLQVRTRSADQDPRGVLDLDDTVADVLLGNYPITLPNGVRVVTIVRASGVSLGQDDRQRWGFSSNYRLGLHRPGTHRL